MLIWCVFHGRLGNNLFQYAAAVAAASRARRPVFLFDFSRLPAGSDARELARLDFVRLGMPGFVLPPLINRLALKMSGRMACELRLLPALGDADLPLISRGVDRSSMLSGYFQDASLAECCALPLRENLWRNLARHAGEPPVFAGGAEETVAVHIRRGDYLEHPFRMVCDREYFLRAMAFLRRTLARPQFHIFSDDPSWCREHFAGEDVQIRDPGCNADALGDLAAMAACRHQIISNSTFSWWAGWLNPNPEKYVVSPERWTNDGSETLEARRFPGLRTLAELPGA